MRRSLCAALAVLALIPAAAGAQTIAITGGRVFPVSGAPIENATVLMRDGKIVAVGADVAIPEGAQRIDAAGRWVTPGIFNPSTLLGLVGVSGIDDTRLIAERVHDPDCISASCLL